MTRRSKSLLQSKSGVYVVPFVGVNTVRSVGGQRALFVAVLDIGDAYFGIEYQLGLGQLVLCVAKKGNFPHFYNITQDDLSETTADLKSKALSGGATLEAIQLLKELTELTTAEEAEMANPKAAAAAKTTKLAKKAEPKASAKGNGEALAAAREARKSKNDGLKIKVLAKENPYREGTKAAATFDLFKAHSGKTVGDVRAAATEDHDLGYLRYSARDGHISVG